MRRQAPPKLANWFLQRFLREDLAEDVGGDLYERFQNKLVTHSRFYAAVDYWYQVVCYMRPFALRKRSRRQQNSFAMIQSYFTTSVRNMRKDKLHAFINVFGLSVGMSVAMMIGLWMKDELSFEKHFEKYDKIGWVLQNVTNNGEVSTWWSVPWPLAEELRRNYAANFEYVVLMTSPDDNILSYEDKNLTQTGIFAEKDFTELFTLRMTAGTRSALKDPSSIIICESLARTYFGDNDPLGKVMTIDSKMTVHVTGVFQDIPEQSEFKDIKFIAPWELLYNETGWIKGMRDPWRPNAFSLYVSIADNHSFGQVSTNIKDAKLKNVSPELAKKKPALFVHPMSRWHLYSRFRNGHQDGGLITYVVLFGIIGVFVTLMACINFMNLSTARSERRAREVGIRKAIGSLRSQLIGQFFSESVLTALVSFVFALLFLKLFLPLFNTLAGKHTFIPWTDPVLWAWAIGLCLFIGILSGSYPALYLSAITPGKALKGIYRASKSSIIPRKLMVIVQFSVSVFLIVGTAVVFQQIQHAKNRPIGYDTDGLVLVRSSKEIHDHIDAIREELIGARQIVEMGEADAPTTESWGSSSAFDWNGKDPNLSVDFANVAVSPEYGKTIEWEILKGRDFSREFASDTSAFIINESAANYMQIKDPIGETVYWYKQPFRVVGVIRDIVANSPFEPVRPTLYFVNKGPMGFSLFRLNPQKPVKDALSHIERLFRKLNPERPFDYRFVDQAYAAKFANDERVGKLAGVFTILAVLISCLGIFGLSSFVAEQRTKEIGIRKVHGASVFQVWKMVSKDFVVLVIIACIVTLPISHILASRWVVRHEYHMEVSWGILLFATVCILSITVLTVSWHTVQAARMSPVKSLRSE